MKKTILLVVSCLFASLVTYAQDSTIAISRNKYIQVDVGVGYLKTDMNSINTSLKSLGYKPIKDNYATLSLSSTYFMNRFLFRGEAQLILPANEMQPDNVRSTFSGYVIGAAIGYAVVQTPRFRLYPYAGIQAYTTNLKFTDLSTVNNMGELVNNGHSTSKIRFSNAALDLGVQLDRMFEIKNNKWACPQNSRYITLGARVGYNWAPGSVKGRYNGVPLEDAPSFSFKGPYVKVVMGIGTKVRALKWK